MLMSLLVRLTDPQIEMADGVVPQVPDAVDDGGRILEQVRAAGLPIHEEALLPDLDVKPLHRDVEPGGQLRGTEQAGIVVPAGTLLGHFEPGTEADPLHRDGKDLLRAVGRAMPLGGEDCGDLVIWQAGTGEIEQTLALLHAARETGESVDLHLHVKLADSPAAPYDPDASNIALAAIENHLLDEVAQQCLALTGGGRRIRPDLRQVAGEDDDLAVERLADHRLRQRLRSGLLGERLLGRTNLVQCRFPPAFQFAGDETVVGIDAVELPFGQSRLLPLALELTFGAGAQRRIHLMPGPAGA